MITTSKFEYKGNIVEYRPKLCTAAVKNSIDHILEVYNANSDTDTFSDGAPELIKQLLDIDTFFDALEKAAVDERAAAVGIVDALVGEDLSGDSDAAVITLGVAIKSRQSALSSVHKNLSGADTDEVLDLAREYLKMVNDDVTALRNHRAKLEAAAQKTVLRLLCKCEQPAEIIPLLHDKHIPEDAIDHIDWFPSQTYGKANPGALSDEEVRATTDEQIKSAVFAEFGPNPDPRQKVALSSELRKELQPELNTNREDYRAWEFVEQCRKYVNNQAAHRKRAATETRTRQRKRKADAVEQQLKQMMES